MRRVVVDSLLKRTLISLALVTGIATGAVSPLHAQAFNRAFDPESNACLVDRSTGRALVRMAPMQLVDLYKSGRRDFRCVNVLHMGPSFGAVSMPEIDLRGANLNHHFLADAKLMRAKMSGVYLFEANLGGAYLTDADLRGSVLVGANLGSAIAYRANLSGADLERATLIGADLENANLKGANLGNAILTLADLEGASLKRANLEGASLQKTDLRRADFENANLSGVSFRGANLAGANLKGAKIEGADFAGAIGLGQVLGIDHDLMRRLLDADDQKPRP